MMRWWDSPEQAVEILKSVDSTDAVQGVGTAVLGYHALSQSALKPLSRRTLVDVNSLLTAVDSIDLSLVSKAVSESVRPVLDQAADAYGELFVQDLHWRAKDSLERLVLSWTAGGMSWPHAIERAAEVYGVPIEKLGKYSAQMKSPVAPMVRQDIADRVLMSYASEKGNLEGQEISKRLQGAELAEFNSERKRDENGRFASAGGGVSQKRLTREERRVRRQRRNARNQRLSAAKVARKQAEEKRAIVDSARKQVEDLLSIFERPKAQLPKYGQQKAAPPKYGQQKAALPKMGVLPKVAVAPKAEAKKISIPKVTEKKATAPKVDLARKYEGAYREKQEGYIAISYEDYKRMRETGKMSAPGPVLSANEVNRIVDNSLLNRAAGEQLSRTVFLRVSDFPVIDGGIDTPDGATIPKEAVLNFKGKGNIEVVLYDDLANRAKEWGSYSTRINVVDVSVNNADDFFSKALQGAELVQFNRERRRDEDGKFAVGGGGTRRERRERRLRRQRRAERRAKAQRARLSANPAEDLRAEISLLNNLVTDRQVTKLPAYGQRKAELPKFARNKFNLRQAAQVEEVEETADTKQVSEKNKPKTAKAFKFKHDLMNSLDQNSMARKALEKKAFTVDIEDFAALFNDYPDAFTDGYKTTMNYVLTDEVIPRAEFNRRTKSARLGNFLFDYTRMHQITDYDPEYERYYTSKEVARSFAEQDVQYSTPEYTKRATFSTEPTMINNKQYWTTEAFHYTKDNNVLVIFNGDEAEKAFRSGNKEFQIKTQRVNLETYLKTQGVTGEELENQLSRYADIPLQFTIATITY